MYTIYAILDNEGEIAYIGQTNDLARRQGEHRRDYRKPLYPFIGSLQNFRLLPLDFASSRDEALNREQYFIDYYTALGLDLKNTLLVH